MPIRSIALAWALVSFSVPAWSFTVVSQETDRWFFKHGKMTRYDGQYENTYEVDLEAGAVTRTRQYEILSRQISPDDTVYRIEKELLSTPGKSNRYVLPPVVRAVGKPDADSVEILVIAESAVTTTRSTSDEVVVSHGRRLS